MANLPLPVPVNVYAQQQAVLEAEATNLASRQALPVPNPTVSFWQKGLDSAILPVEDNNGPLPTDVDICIIGSGISGVAAAYHFAKQFAREHSRTEPVKAVILEARDFC
jgi:hypothetical protein